MSEYSLILHLYVDTESKKIVKRTATNLRVEGSQKEQVVVWPVYALHEVLKKKDRKRLEDDVIKAWKRFGISINSEDVLHQEIEIK